MSADLLRYLGAPAPYSVWWLVAGLMIVAAVIGWCAVVFVWTMPPDTLRRIPVVRTVHEGIVRRRFTRAIRGAVEAYQAGDATAADAATTMRTALRGFLVLQVGGRARYLHVAEMADTDLAPAAPVFSDLNDAQFNTASSVDLDKVGHTAEELIRSWS
jgi:hypothetical protein